MNVWRAFESVAARCGESVAVEVQRSATVETWTYGQLHAAARAHAEWLVGSGLQAGDRCALLADNDARWCAAYLGTLSVGGIVVPLDTNYTAAQIATIVREAGSRMLLVNERLEPVAREALAGLDVTVGVLEHLPSTPLGTVAPHDTADAATALILYTSGTTADPKGVVLSHANVLAARDAVLAVVNVSDDDRVLGLLPLFNALAQLTNLLLPFAAGAGAVFFEVQTPNQLVRGWGERRVTICACAPQVLELIHQHLLGEVAKGRFGRAAVRLLLAISFRLRRAKVDIGRLLFKRVHRLLGGQTRLFVTGGSKVDAAITRDFYAFGFTVLQTYGLAETSGAATITTGDDPHIETVGRALPGYEIRIMPAEDPHLDGEIAIRGPAIMQGYYNDPDATAAVMHDDWFLTEDLGRFDHERRLSITGRKKEVIVLASGQHIDPEEIERQYRQSPFVKEVAIMRLTDNDAATDRLFAVVVPDMEQLRQRRIANAGDLIRFEIEGQSIHLPPDQRVIGYDVWFEPLPRTTTGALKRREIERRVKRKHDDAESRRRGAGSQGAAWEGDAHAIEAVAIIARRARGAPVAPDSNLELDLALDSIERVELIADLEQRFGVRVEDDQTPTILTVAQLIDAVRPERQLESAPATETAWAILLRNLPPSSDPVLAPLLRKRLLIPALFFVVLRALRLVLPRVVHSGLSHVPTTGPLIISPNHQSYLDPLFVCSVLPFGVLRQLFLVGATEYFETPLTTWLARQLNLVPVDPDANLVPAMKAAAFGLTHGRILVLFPEGERSIDGTVKRFKKGAPILSRHLAVPIIPVAIHGVYELWPRNRSFNWRLLRPWSRHVVHVTFGPPMRVADDVTYAEATAALRDCVKKMWDETATAQHQPARHRGR